jgi:chromate transporter
MVEPGKTQALRKPKTFAALPTGFYLSRTSGDIAHAPPPDSSRMPDRTPAPHASLSSLFLAFLQVSGLAFGGGLVWARRIVVEQRHWTTDEEFTDILSLCQFLPGPNIIGIAVCVGAKLKGLAGTLAAIAGFVLIPCAIGFTLGLWYLRYAHLPVLRNILTGISAVAAGLLIATGIRLLRPRRTRPRAWIVAALAFAGMAFTKLPLLAVLFGATLLSLAAVKIESATAK